jgi:hypothetical protein
MDSGDCAIILTAPRNLPREAPTPAVPNRRQIFFVRNNGTLHIDGVGDANQLQSQR